MDINLVKKIAKSWRRIDWDNLQIRLDEEVKAIGGRQDESENAKKYLIEVSTSFRENTDKTIRKAALPLIRAFQSEVDRLTLQNKTIETVIIDICRSLTQLPDPSPFLEELEIILPKLDKLNLYEEELITLRCHLNDLQSEYSDLHNQEVTLRELREKLKESNEITQQLLSKKEEEFQEEINIMKIEMNEKFEEFSEEKKQLHNTIDDLQKKNHEIAQNLEGMKLKFQQKEMIEEEQLMIATNDLEIAVKRVDEAEKEIIRLSNELNRLKNDNTTMQENNNIYESTLIQTKDRQVQKLIEENKILSAKLAEQALESRLRIEELTQELQHHVDLVNRLEIQLKAQSDYEDIKRELRILRNVEFGEEIWTNERESIDQLTSAATATAEVHLGGHLKALDELLIDKNRKLQNENVEQRMKVHELEDRLANANDQINQLNAENEEKRKLISRLEADIINFQIDNRGCVNTIEDEKLIGHDSSLSEILSEDINDNEKDENLKGNVLKIVISQRDRLKSRYDEIHNELTICKENNILLKHELEKTQEDNVNLYGKIKFLQSYNNKNNQVKDSNVIDIEARYESDYERHLDPFRKFHIQEGKRKYAQLRPHDKAALSLSRWILSNAQTRLTIFIYLFILHILVFLVLYRYANIESCQRDFQADCLAKFQQHMHIYHSNANGMEN